MALFQPSQSILHLRESRSRRRPAPSGLHLFFGHLCTFFHCLLGCTAEPWRVEVAWRKPHKLVYVATLVGVLLAVCGRAVAEMNLGLPSFEKLNKRCMKIFFFGPQTTHFQPDGVSMHLLLLHQHGALSRSGFFYEPSGKSEYRSSWKVPVAPKVGFDKVVRLGNRRLLLGCQAFSNLAWSSDRRSTPIYRPSGHFWWKGHCASPSGQMPSNPPL